LRKFGIAVFFSLRKTEMRVATGMARKGIVFLTLVNSPQEALMLTALLDFKQKGFHEFMHRVWIEKSFVMK
jgi:hypothetical protein